MADMQGAGFAGNGIHLRIAGIDLRTVCFSVNATSLSEDLQPPILFMRSLVRAIFDATSPQRFWSGRFELPVDGQAISEFGKRSVYNGQPRSPHSGTDFQAVTGTQVRAPNAGKVVLAAELYYSGNTVIFDHGLGLYSYFGHLSAISVQEQNSVTTGEVVGKVGATGLVTGPHLHWSVRLAGTRVDPLSLLSLLGNGPLAER
jgi:murein DD-endopeptidase MepM/ murein hydrolase activator NlpD